MKNLDMAKQICAQLIVNEKQREMTTQNQWVIDDRIGKLELLQKLLENPEDTHVEIPFK